jgi:hypothetical protein
MAGKFVLKKSSGGKYDFVLKAGNGEIIATSETYTARLPPGTGSSRSRRARREPRSTTRPANNPSASKAGALG